MKVGWDSCFPFFTAALFVAETFLFLATLKTFSFSHIYFFCPWYVTVYLLQKNRVNLYLLQDVCLLLKRSQ